MWAGSTSFSCMPTAATKMWIDDQLVADHWRQGWLAWNDLAQVHFEAGTKHKIKVEWVKEGASTCVLTWKPPEKDAAGNTSLWSQVGEGIDYYFIYGGTGPGRWTCDRGVSAAHGQGADDAGVGVRAVAIAAAV